MIAIGLIFGDLKAEHYENDVAADPRIDTLRTKMQVVEDERFSRDYHDPDKRSIANSMRIIFKDGSSTENVTVEYPIGHKRRREEGVPVLLSKFEKNLRTQFSAEITNKIIETMSDTNALCSMLVSDFMDLWVQ